MPAAIVNSQNVTFAVGGGSPDLSYVSGCIDYLSGITEQQVYVSSTTGWDTAAYTGDANVLVADHLISGKDWHDEITAASGNAYSQSTAYTYGVVGDIESLLASI